MRYNARMLKIIGGVGAVFAVIGVIVSIVLQPEELPAPPIVTEDAVAAEATAEIAAEKMALTFSGTQTLAERFEKYTRPLPKQLADAVATITIAPPPQTYAEVAAELQLLHAYADARDEATLEAIDFEIPVENFTFGQYRLGDLSLSKPKTKKMLDEVLADYDYLIFKFKLEYDRVRPSIIDPTLTTVMPVPDHPAYPSRHSSQTHLLAHVFGYLDPANAAMYMSDADQISENRERAGVHYPSDTRAGESLAQQYFAYLLTQEAFRAQLDELQREEW